MPDRWPFPGDLPIARARRVALAYRAKLQELDAGAVEALDSQFIHCGQTWVAQRVVTYDLDDWLTPAQAAEIAATSTANLRRLRRDKKLRGRLGTDGIWRYQAREVMSVISATRKRK